MGKLIVLIEQTKAVADLEIEVAFWESRMGDAGGVVGDGIVAKEGFMHTHCTASCRALHLRPTVAVENYHTRCCENRCWAENSGLKLANSIQRLGNERG